MAEGIHTVTPGLLSHEELKKVIELLIVAYGDSPKLVQFIKHYDLLEFRLDEMEDEGMFGSIGWRKLVGIPVDAVSNRKEPGGLDAADKA